MVVFIQGAGQTAQQRWVTEESLAETSQGQRLYLKEPTVTNAVLSKSHAVLFQDSHFQPVVSGIQREINQRLMMRKR
jgi:hypothetical protein